MDLHVKQVAIYVRDLERALAFYTQKLGFQVETDEPLGAGRWIELSSPGYPTRIVLCLAPTGHAGPTGGLSNVMFACADVQAAYASLRARGVEFAQAPRHEPWGTLAVFEDPDGNQFSLATP